MDRGTVQDSSEKSYGHLPIVLNKSFPPHQYRQEAEARREAEQDASEAQCRLQQSHEAAVQLLQLLPRLTCAAIAAQPALVSPVGALCIH